MKRPGTFRFLVIYFGAFANMVSSHKLVSQILLASAATAALFPDCQSGPLANNTVCDSSADTLTRARALVAVLTNEEKFNLTGNTSPGVPRLGLPSYQWWRKFDHSE